MQQEPEVVEVLQGIVASVDDDERRALEDAAIKPYDSGLHEGDPDEQPDQDSQPEATP